MAVNSNLFTLPPYNQHEWQKFLVTFSRSAEFTVLAQAVLSDNDQRELALKNSYQHALGFTKICLLRDAYATLRAHIWCPESRNAVATVKQEALVPHDHEGNYMTNLICGSYLQRLWERSASGSLFHEFMPGMRSPRSRRRFVSIGEETRLDVIEEEHYKRGDNYFLNRTTIHTVTIPVDQLTISLSLRQNTNRVSHFFRPASMHPPCSSNIPSLTSGELEQALCLISGEMSLD